MTAYPHLTGICIMVRREKRADRMSMQPFLAAPCLHWEAMWGHLPRASGLLRPSPMELDLIHGPHGPLHVLQPHKTFVEAQVVSHCILEKGSEEKHTDRRTDRHTPWFD